MLLSVLLGIYLTVYSDRIIKGDNLVKAFLNSGYSNLLLLFSVILFFSQIYLGILERKQTESETEKLVNSILKAACNTMVYPNTNLHIRAIVTVCDYTKKIRKTCYSYNIESDPERTAIYDLDFGVTGQAIAKKIPIAEALLDNHISTYSEQNAKYVDPDLKCVLAAPIFSAYDRSKVIAVLAFDSDETLQKMKFDTKRSREIAQMWADTLTHVIE